MDQRSRYSLAIGMGAVEKGVEIGQQGVADVQIMSGGNQQLRIFTKGSRVLVLHGNRSNY